MLCIYGSCGSLYADKNINTLVCSVSMVVAEECMLIGTLKWYALCQCSGGRVYADWNINLLVCSVSIAVAGDCMRIGCKRFFLCSATMVVVGDSMLTGI